MSIVFVNCLFIKRNYSLAQILIVHIFTVQEQSESHSVVSDSLHPPWAIQSMEFSRPEYWSGKPFPSPRDLTNPGIKPISPSLQMDSLPAEPPGKSKQEQRSVTNFHGTQPKEILSTPKSLCTLKHTCLPHLLKIFYGIIISIEICICLFLGSATANIESCISQGDNKCSDNMKMMGQKATHLRFCQRTRSHDSFSSWQLNNDVLPDRQRNGQGWVSWIGYEVYEIGSLIWLDVKTLMTLPPVVKRPLTVHSRPVTGAIDKAPALHPPHQSAG